MLDRIGNLFPLFLHETVLYKPIPKPISPMKPIPTLHYLKMYTIASNINPHLSSLGFEIVKIL